MGIIICPPPPRDSLPSSAIPHPGFGSVEIRRAGKTIHYDVHGDGKHGPLSAGGLARKFVRNDKRKYELLIDGPLASYDYKWSHAKTAWFLVKRRNGFA